MQSLRSNTLIFSVSSLLCMLFVFTFCTREEKLCTDKNKKVFEVDGLGKFCLKLEGKDYIKDSIRENKTWEPWLIDIIEHHSKQGALVIDIGAHIGVHTIRMANAAGSKGKVVAFEPQTLIYNELITNLKLNNIENTTVHKIALGDTTGFVEFDTPVKGNEGGTGIKNPEHIELVEQGSEKTDKILVEIRTLDSFNFKNVSLLKIDVEGAENAVLRGARKTIMESRPAILIEILGGQGRTDAKQEIDKTIRIIEDMDYEVVPIYFHDYVALPRENMKTHKK